MIMIFAPLLRLYCDIVLGLLDVCTLILLKPSRLHSPIQHVHSIIIIDSPRFDAILFLLYLHRFMPFGSFYLCTQTHTFIHIHSYSAGLLLKALLP